MYDMKTIIFALITLIISPINLSLEAARANPPHIDADLIAYAASVPEFKASVWIKPGCSAHRVSLSENDSYDFYIAAAHCVDDNPSSFDNEEKNLYEELLENGFFNLNNFTCENINENKGYKELENLDDCKLALTWHSLVKNAIQVGLIETYPSSAQAFFDFLMTILQPVSNDDIVALKNLKCIIHISYENDEKNEIDLALCTTHQKDPNLIRYNVKYIKDITEIQDKVLVSASFEMGKTTEISAPFGIGKPRDIIPNRRAFNTLVKSGRVPTELESVESQEMPINERPTGHWESTDNGAALLFQDDNGLYTLIGVIKERASEDVISYSVFDPQFIANAYEQLIKDGPGEVEKADL